MWVIREKIENGPKMLYVFVKSGYVEDFTLLLLSF